MAHASFSRQQKQRVFRYIFVLGILAICFLPAGRAYAENDQILNMKNADIEAFIDDVSSLTGATFIIDPKVKGKVSVTSTTPLSRDQIFQVFLATLRVHGFASVSVSDNVFKIVPSENAVNDNAEPGSEGMTGDQFATEVFHLRSFDAIEAAKMIKPMIHRQGHVAAAKGGRDLIVVDAATNLARIRDIIRELDQDHDVIETIALDNISATELARILGNLLKTSTGEDGGVAGLSVVAVEGNNSLLVRGAPDAAKRLARIAKRLDQMNRSVGDLSVIYLKNAKAEELVPIIQEVSKSLTENGSAASQATIAFHGPTNALIVNADPETRQAIEGVIRQLDIRRAQVLVEAIIVELSDTVARQLGVQFLLSGNGESKVPFAATSFTRSAPNLLAITGAVATGEGGASSADSGLVDLALGSLLGLDGLAGGIGGQASDGTLFGVIIDAVERDTGSNILSTPSIMTLDNETASIIVGQEIPVTTGEALGSDNLNPFRTIDRQDVGIQLDVLPQINEGNAIRLHIRQEVSSIFGPVNGLSGELVTNKRELETTVLADDGEVIVLGGLIEESDQVSESKVPLLGDIPGFGRLFRSKSHSRGKTNLMIFIRPTIIRDPASARAVTSRKYNYLQAEELLRGGGQQQALEDLFLNLLGSEEVNDAK